MIIRSTIAFIYIYFLSIQFYCRAQNLCGEECLSCVASIIDKKLNVCTQCQEDYYLNENNLCVYNRCSNNLFYDKSSYDYSKDNNSCVAVCSPSSWKNQQTNSCQSQLKCSTLVNSKQNPYYGENIRDFYVYQNDYYVAQSTYLSIYDKNDLFFIKSLPFQAKDLNVFNINGIIFVISSDNQISTWDIKKEQRISKQFDIQSFISLNQNTKIASLQNQYALAYNILSQNMTFQIFYDQLNQIFYQSNNFTINGSVKQIMLIDQMLFVNNSTNITVYQIQVYKDNDNLNLNMQNKYTFQTQQNNSNYFNILSTSQLGIYLVVQDQSVQIVNINNNQIDSIQIGLKNNQKIIQSRIFQVSDTDKQQYLLICTSDQLIYYNLQSNSSNLITVNYQQIKYFEICNFWGNEYQVIVIYENLQLQVFYFDNYLFNFTLSKQIYSLKSYPQSIFLVKYSNLSKNNHKNNNSDQFIYELVSATSASIQIIKQGNLYQQQKQLIQVQMITNFNSSYPTPSPNYNFDTDILPIQQSVLIYNPSLIIQVNKFGEINFYDSSDVMNCKIKKQLQLSKYINYITKFFNNQVIVSHLSEVFIINIFTQNIMRYFSTSYISFATNNDILVMIFNFCLRVFSSELFVLYENCQGDLQYLYSGQTIYLNNDLRILLTEQSVGSNKRLNLTVYQIDLNKQTIQKINKLSNIDCFSFEVIYKFSSLQDEINNKFSIEQIVIFGNSNSFQIYDLSLSLIYKIDSTKISNVQLINRVFNDDNSYILIRKDSLNQLLFIETSTGNQNLLQLDFPVNYKSQIFETLKKINEYGRVYYLIRLFNNDTIYEYQIDIKRNITYITGLDYVRDSALYPQYLQNIKRSKNISINYFAGGQTGLLFSSISQKSRYLKIQYQSKSQIQKILQNIKLGVYFFIFNDYVSSIDMFTNKEQQITQQGISVNKLFIRDNTMMVVWKAGSGSISIDNRFGKIDLIDINSRNITYSYSSMEIINGVNYDENDNLFYGYGTNILIFNLKLELIQTIDQGNFEQCFNSQIKFICLQQNYISSEQKSQYFLFLYDKKQKIKQKFDLGKYNGGSYAAKMIVDQQYENIFIFDDTKYQIYDFNGFFKKSFGKKIDKCKIQIQMMICESQNKLLLIDRLSFAFTELGVPDDNSTNLNYIYIDFLNYVLFQTSGSPYQVSVMDVSTKQIVNSFSSGISQNQQIRADIIDFQFDYSSSNCVLYLDKAGTFYLFSLDKQLPYQNYIKNNEIADGNEIVSNFYYNNQTNDIFIYGDSIYKIDYSKLGWQFEPQLNEPYNFFTKISINSQQIDYLIFNRQNNNLFRYTNQNLKFELDINDSKIIDMQYNQSSDILIFGLTDSLLFFQQYQSIKNNYETPNIYKLENIYFQQFITDSIIITCDQKILHLDIENGIIISTIQFNSTQLVTSFSLNKNKNLLVIGFSDGQIILYNTSNQTYFIKGISKDDILNSSINTIYFIENSDTQQLACVVSSSAILLQIDVLNQQVIQQIDLKILVNEDSNLSIAKFLIDQVYQRYIFCFVGQKKAYVWNISQKQQEQYLLLPSIQISQLKIEKNYICIQNGFQINLYSLGTKIQFLTVIKKNLMRDKITDFKVVLDEAIAIFFIDKFELFLINGTNIHFVSQQNYTYPKILDYNFDSQSKTLKIIGMHRAGIFENNFDLDNLSQDQKFQCNLLITIASQVNIMREITNIFPKQTQIQSIKGIYLSNQQNQQNSVYLEIPGQNLQNIIRQTSQVNNNQLIISSNNKLNNTVPLQNDTFSDLSLPIFQFANFKLDFQNNTNLAINMTQNVNTQQIIFQNITLYLQCLGSNKIGISNIDKVIFQNIKINQLDFSDCIENRQQNPLFLFYNISQIFIYDIEISNNNFYQTSDIPIFQFEKVDTIVINSTTITQNTNLNSIMSFLDMLQQNNPQNNQQQNGIENQGAQSQKSLNIKSYQNYV
ncbi:hypothetical protein ABPG73_016853 [Tetrahymena malaccensis]